MKETEIHTGIVLRTERVKEADIKVNILTPSGIKTATAAGAAKQTAKLKGSVQLFTIAEFSITGTKVTGAHTLQTGMNIAREINRYYLACAICEVLLKCHLGTDSYAQIFYLTARSMETLNNEKTSAYKVFINFFAKLLILQGYDTNKNTTISNEQVLRKIDEFKHLADEDIDKVKIDLACAKECVKHLNESYLEHLDFKIPCAEHFS